MDRYNFDTDFRKNTKKNLTQKFQLFVSGGIFLFRLVSNRSFTSGIGPGFKNPWSSPWEKQEILLSLILYMIETHDDDRPEGPQFLSTALYIQHTFMYT